MRDDEPSQESMPTIFVDVDQYVPLDDVDTDVDDDFMLSRETSTTHPGPVPPRTIDVPTHVGGPAPVAWPARPLPCPARGIDATGDADMDGSLGGSETLPAVQEPLTAQELDFAFALTEFSGNYAAAYRFAYGDGVPTSTAKALGLELFKNPAIVARFEELRAIELRHSTVTKEDSAYQFARIRDLAMALGSPKDANVSERNRGELFNLYQKEEVKGTGQVSISINLAGELVSADQLRKREVIIENGNDS